VSLPFSSKTNGLLNRWNQAMPLQTLRDAAKLELYALTKQGTLPWT
jgi:hypothetical protein